MKTSGMVDVNRRKKINRFVAAIDEWSREQNLDPEKNKAHALDVAAEIENRGYSAFWGPLIERMHKAAVAAEHKACHAENRSWRNVKRENVPSPETRLGITNVYRVRAGYELLDKTWDLPLEECPRCKKTTRPWDRRQCADCEACEDEEVVGEYLRNVESNPVANALGQATRKREQQSEEVAP